MSRVFGRGVIAFVIVVLLAVTLMAVRFPRSSQTVTVRRFAGTPRRLPLSPPPTAQRATVPSEPVQTPIDVPLAAPARPGDTDLWSEPLAAYAGGPPADRLTVHGLRIGLPVSDIPAGLLSERTTDHLRDTGGNLYAVDDGRIGEVHIRDPDLLARLPIDGTHALFARFGEPNDIYTGDGNEAFPTFIYPDRGIHVRWDNTLEKILEVVLVRPNRR